MFNIPAGKIQEFHKIYENHILNISACNIFFYHIKLVAHRPTLLKRDDYYEYYNIFSDIELKTAPMDTFVEIPDEPETSEENGEETGEELNEKSFEAILNEMPHIVEINRICPEFIQIQNRITKENILQNFPEDHPVTAAIKADENNLDKFVEDCFIHWSVDAYLKNIDKLRLSLISNATPLIEWTVENISEKDLKNYLMTTRRINIEKVFEKSEDIFFKPDYNFTCKFYKENEEFNIDVDNLMQRMISNEVIKSDIYIIIAIYMILTYCKVPIAGKETTDERCVNYIRDVISKA